MAVEGTRQIKDEILPYLPPALKTLLHAVEDNRLNDLEEIRLRCRQPLLLKLGENDFTITPRGGLSRDLESGYRVGEEDLYRSLASISDNSLYAFEEDIRKGFITLPGGHRVGLAGQVITQGNEVVNMKDFSGMCFRIARQVRDVSQPLLAHIFDNQARMPFSILIVSPPRCGKTTMLRDLARVVSSGSRWGNPRNVVIVDERSELAGCFRGVPQLDVGPRTDVLDSCPKAKGMTMAIRSLSPEVIVTDELGRAEDIEAVRECINAGVILMASIHAGSEEELKRRPLMRELLATGAFRLGVILGRSCGPGTIKQIVRWDDECWS